jgi:sugar phosphate isomerase/epimerase
MASDLDMVVEAGASAVAILRSVASQAGLAATARLLEDRALTVSSMIAGLRILDLPAESCTEELGSAIRTAAAIGAPIILVTTGPLASGRPEEADDQVVSRLRQVASLALDAGVTLGLEPLHPFLRTMTYVHTVAHAVEIVSQVPGAGIVLDVGHVYWDRGVYAAISEHASHICSVQLTDLSATGIEARRWVRCALGEGVVPVEALVRCLDAAGFEGFYEDEILGVTGPAECLAGIRSARQWFEALWA